MLRDGVAVGPGASFGEAGCAAGGEAADYFGGGAVGGGKALPVAGAVGEEDGGPALGGGVAGWLRGEVVEEEDVVGGDIVLFGCLVAFWEQVFFGDDEGCGGDFDVVA